MKTNKKQEKQEKLKEDHQNLRTYVKLIAYNEGYYTEDENHFSNQDILDHLQNDLLKEVLNEN